MDNAGCLEKDPVCGMTVDQWRDQVVFRGVGYAFCSQQCRERFTAGPGLYVGRRRSLAPKQKGMEVIKRRPFVFAMPLMPPRYVELKGALLTMMGVMAVRPTERMIDRRCDQRRRESGDRADIGIEAVEITYDLLQATAAQIERKMAELNATLSDGWGEKLHRDCIRYLENCELEDLEIRDTVQIRWGSRARRTASGSCGGAGTRFERTMPDLGG